MAEDEINKKYNLYWEKRLYSNMAFTQKYIPLMAAFGVGLLSYNYHGYLNITFIIIPIIYYLYIKLVMFILEKKIIKNFGNYVGILIFALLTFLKLILNYYYHEYTYPAAETQYISLLSWLFMKNFEISIICEALNKLIQVYFNYYWFEIIPKSNFVIDMVTSTLYYSVLCYIVDKVNLKLFLSLSMKLNDAITELSKGIDNISEHLIILNMDESKRFYLYHSSAEFKYRYINQNSKIEDNNNKNLEGLFEKFSYASNDNQKINHDYNLLSDLRDLVDVNKRTLSKNYSNIYIKVDKDVKKYEYFEVKYTIFTTDVLRNEGYENKSILMLIKSIDYETYNMKNQQITDFGNIVISSLTHELKNPLNGLYGQLHLINKQNLSNNNFDELIENSIEDKASMLRIELNDKENNLIKYFQKNNCNIVKELEKHKDNYKILGTFHNNLATIKTLLLCNYYNSNQLLRTYLKYSKYFKSKLNLIISNFEIFSKLEFNLTFNVQMNDINLSYLLNKSFKILYPMVELNKNNLKLSTEIANFCMIKTDPIIFKIIIQNILLLIDKRTNKGNSNLEINVEKKRHELILEEVKRSDIQIHFIVHNVLLSNSSDNEISHQESKDVIDILNKNNYRLSKLINCEYEEVYNSNLLLLKYTLIISSNTVEENYLSNVVDLVSDSNTNNTIPISTERKSVVNQRLDSNKIIIRSVEDKPSSRFFPNNNLKDEAINKDVENDYDNLEEYNNNSIQINKVKGSRVHTLKAVSTDINIYEPYVSHLPRSESQCRCFRVLIVDDDSLCISYLANVIKINGEKYEIAYNGQEAFDKMKKLIDTNCQSCNNKSIIIFMDIHMPILNGIDSAKMIDEYLKINANGYKCKLYFISANIGSQFSDILNTISICAGLLNKPIKKTDILKIVQDDYKNSIG